MRYIGQPLLTVIDYENSKKIFQFDDKGEFITEDKNIIEFMRKYKSFIKCEDTKEYKCKNCNYTTTNKGELLAHYREHKKG